jgi:hypothetical protein
MKFGNDKGEADLAGQFHCKDVRLAMIGYSVLWVCNIGESLRGLCTTEAASG